MPNAFQMYIHLSQKPFPLHFVKLSNRVFFIYHGKESFNSSNAKWLNAMSVSVINAFSKNMFNKTWFMISQGVNYLYANLPNWLWQTRSSSLNLPPPENTNDFSFHFISRIGNENPGFCCDPDRILFGTPNVWLPVACLIHFTDRCQLQMICRENHKHLIRRFTQQSLYQQCVILRYLESLLVSKQICVQIKDFNSLILTELKQWFVCPSCRKSNNTAYKELARYKHYSRVEIMLCFQLFMIYA